MPIAIGTIFIFSFFANNVRTAGPIAIGRGTISASPYCDVFGPREDDGAY